MTIFNSNMVFEVLIRMYVDGVSLREAITKVLNFEPSELHIQQFEELVRGMRSGWVQMNENIRGLGDH